jgi:hypothetical protein
MQHKIIITATSFDFGGNGNFDNLFMGIEQSSQLIQKIHSDFNSFGLTSDFYDCIGLINANYSSDESGIILKSVWDGNGIGKLGTLALAHADIVALVEQQSNLPDEYYTLFVKNPNIQMTALKAAFIENETDVLNHACYVLKEYPTAPDDYGHNLTLTFNNLIFHPSFNKLPKIKDGYKSFVGEMVNFLALANGFEQSESNVMEDIKKLNSPMLYTVCEEGGGKKKGKITRTYKVNNEELTINSEYHYKLEFKDGQNKKGHYYNDNRIYFGFIKAVNPMKIAIAHIGDHL